MDEQCKRQILDEAFRRLENQGGQSIYDWLTERLKAERKFILDALADVIAHERQSAGSDLCEEIRQSRLELGQLNAMIDELRRDLRQLQQAGSLPATPAGKHELN
jgi:hypothetical protein